MRLQVEVDLLALDCGAFSLDVMQSSGMAPQLNVLSRVQRWVLDEQGQVEGPYTPPRIEAMAPDAADGTAAALTPAEERLLAGLDEDTKQQALEYRQQAVAFLELQRRVANGRETYCGPCFGADDDGQAAPAPARGGDQGTAATTTSACCNSVAHRRAVCRGAFPPVFGGGRSGAARRLPSPRRSASASGGGQLPPGAWGGPLARRRTARAFGAQSGVPAHLQFLASHPPAALRTVVSGTEERARGHAQRVRVHGGRVAPRHHGAVFLQAGAGDVSPPGPTRLDRGVVRVFGDRSDGGARSRARAHDPCVRRAAGHLRVLRPATDPRGVCGVARIRPVAFRGAVVCHCGRRVYGERPAGPGAVRGGSGAGSAQAAHAQASVSGRARARFSRSHRGGIDGGGAAARSLLGRAHSTDRIRWPYPNPFSFSTHRSAEERSAKAAKAKPFGVPVNLSRARKIRVTRPNGASSMRKSSSVALSVRLLMRTEFSSRRAYMLSPWRSCVPAPARIDGGT
eukprot:ctg_2067.g544